MIRTTATATTALALAAALAACGGGGSSSGGGSTAVTSTGVITGFGSVFVNGTRYDTSGAVVEFENGDLRTEDDLRLGMKVRVRATESGGERRALRIRFDNDFKGPARDVTPDADNPAIGTFTVLGQQVTVDENTVFDDDVGDTNEDGAIDIRDLDTDRGQVVVEISGFPTDDGILATRIDRVNAAAGDFGRPDVDDDEFEIKGFVDSVADDGSSFVINGVTFLVDVRTEFDDGLAPNQELVGVFVEVEADLDGNGDLIAREVEREDDFDDDRNGEFEIEGVLQDVDTDSDPNTFTINGITVEVVDASRLAGREGNRVEVKGSFNADGLLVLREAKLEVENSVRTEDRVASVGATSFTTRLGLEITPTGTSRVRFDDDDDDGPGRGRGRGRGPSDRVTPDEFLARLQIDDEIEARGFPNPDGSVTWTRIEREDRDDDDRECELRGPVQSIDANAFTFVIQGVTVFTDGAREFEGDGEGEIGRQAFFDRLAPGAVVKAESDEDAGDSACQPGELTAEKVEFEDDDGVFGTVPRGDDSDDDDSDDDSDDDNGGDDNSDDD